MGNRNYFILLASVWILITMVSTSELGRWIARVVVLYAAVSAVFADNKISFTAHMLRRPEVPGGSNNKNNDDGIPQ